MSFQDSRLFQEINEKFQELKSSLKQEFDEVYYDDRINSRMAKMTCYMVSTSTNFKYTYEQCATRWLQELITIKLIADTSRKMFPKNPIDQAIYFVAHVQYYLLYKRLSAETKDLELACPYTDGARNFIVSLIETNQCLCSCYSYYVLACAEEFGFEGYVGLCNTPGHVFNVVFDTFQGDNGMGVISLDAAGNSIIYRINQKYLNIQFPHHFTIWKEVVENLESTILHQDSSIYFQDLSGQAFHRDFSNFKVCNVESFEGLFSSFNLLRVEILNNKHGPYRTARLLLLGKLYDEQEIVESAVISATALQFHWNVFYKIGHVNKVSQKESKYLESHILKWFDTKVKDVNPNLYQAIKDLVIRIVQEPIRFISDYIKVSNTLFNVLDRILVPKSHFEIIYKKAHYSCLIRYSDQFTNILITNDVDDFAFYYDNVDNNVDLNNFMSAYYHNDSNNNAYIYMSSNCDDLPNVTIIPDLDYVVLVWKSNVAPLEPSISRKRKTKYNIKCAEIQMKKCENLQKCWNSFMFDDLSCTQFCESNLPYSLATIPKIFLEIKSIYLNLERLQLSRMIIMARNKRTRVNLGFILENPKELPSQLIFEDLKDSNTVLDMCRDFFLENKSKSEFVFQLYFPLSQESNPNSTIILELSNGKSMEFNQVTQIQDKICLEVTVARLVSLLPF